MDQSSECEFNIEELSEYEVAAQTVHAQHSAATMSLLQSLKSMDHAMKVLQGMALSSSLQKEVAN